MKRILLSFLLCLVIEARSILAEQNVVSRPIGVVRIKIPEKAQSLVSIPL